MMKEKAALPWEQQGPASNLSNEDLKSLDSDALKLTSMGYKPALRRNYSVLSVLAVGFSLTNSWFAISAALITGTSTACIFPSLTLYMQCLGSLHTGEALSKAFGLSARRDINQVPSLLTTA